MNGILRLWVAGFLVLAPAAAHADYDSGKKAYDAGDYAAAMREWRPLAEAGDADAQRGMGYIYRFGRGVAVDNEEAVKLYTSSAQQGNMYGQHALGVMFDFRLGVPRDGLNRLRARCLYLLSAKQGYARAQYALYLLYGELGDSDEGNRWYYRALAQGQPGAMFEQGRAMLWNPLVFDKTGAYMYLILSARKDHKGAVEFLARERAEANAKTKRVMAAAERRADAWRPKIEPHPAERPTVPELCLPGR